MLVNQWNRMYGPNVKNESGVCMPKSVMFQASLTIFVEAFFVSPNFSTTIFPLQLGKHTWTGRSVSSGYGEERSYMLLEITTYGFAEALKERRFKSPNGEAVTPKITLDDLDVYIKIASTKVSKSKSDKSNSAASSNHTIVYDSLEGNSRMSKDLLKATAFDRWGFKMKLNPFLKMVASSFMAEVAEDCSKVLKCKGLDESEALSEGIQELAASEASTASAASKGRKPSTASAAKKRKQPAPKKTQPEKKPKIEPKKSRRGKNQLVSVLEHEAAEEKGKEKEEEEIREVEDEEEEEEEEEEEFPMTQELLEHPKKNNKTKSRTPASRAARKKLNFSSNSIRDEQEKTPDSEDEEEEYQPPEDPEEEDAEESEDEYDREFIDDSDDYDDDPIEYLNEMQDEEIEGPTPQLQNKGKKKIGVSKAAARGKK